MGASKGRVFIVGDDCQAIYGFRGAAHNGIDMMKAKLNAIEVGLTITQRCPKAIVREVIKYVPDYRAADNAPEGSVFTMELDAAIASAKVGDVILSRANAPLMPICLSLLRNGVAARIEGRDIGAMLVSKVEKLKANSIPDFLRKVVANKARRIARAQARKAADSDIVAIEDEAETLIALADGMKNITSLKARIVDLFQDSDKCPKPAVVLSSVHKAKGLEWNKVFMIRSTFLKKGRETREEEFLFYVAATRSKNTLVYAVEKEQSNEQKN
jgi:superfamily I DNA/RNA helicase